MRTVCRVPCENLKPILSFFEDLSYSLKLSIFLKKKFFFFWCRIFLERIRDLWGIEKYYIFVSIKEICAGIFNDKNSFHKDSFFNEIVLYKNINEREEAKKFLSWLLSMLDSRERKPQLA